jgi:Tfp pilus assembly protein PilX
MRRHPNSLRRQHGTTLLIALIFLVILTLFAVSGMNTGVINLRTANNAQMIIEAEFAGQQQIETMLNAATNFTEAAAVPAVATTNVDVNSDGQTDFVVTTTRPRCLSWQPAAGYSYLVAGSEPKDTVWEVEVTARDSIFGATSRLRQGVKVRVPVTGVCVNPA